MAFVSKKEGEAKLSVPTGKISKELPVFYNPVMELNRSLSVLALDAFYSSHKKPVTLSFPLAGSGARGIRMLLESKAKIEKARFNDLNPRAATLIETNLKANKIRKSLFEISNDDALEFMLKNRSAHYVDIDPFGTPNPFLDIAVRRTRTPGLLAVTATDTSALCGTYPSACRRKYWAEPERGPQMHELGLRILIRKVQLVGAQHDRALIPVMSYSKDHYMRIIFLSEKGKSKVDKMIMHHGMHGAAGPLWTSRLQSSAFIRTMRKSCNDEKTASFLKMLLDENSVPVVGVHDLHRICKSLRISVPRTEKVITTLRKRGHKAVRSHSNLEAIKTDAKLKTIERILKKL